MSGFFEELQRRKVYRVAAAYIVAAGFLIQIASAAFLAWELPNWSLRLVIVLLLIAFPIALTPRRKGTRISSVLLLALAPISIFAAAGNHALSQLAGYRVVPVHYR